MVLPNEILRRSSSRLAFPSRCPTVSPWQAENKTPHFSRWLCLTLIFFLFASQWCLSYLCCFSFPTFALSFIACHITVLNYSHSSPPSPSSLSLFFIFFYSRLFSRCDKWHTCHVCDRVVRAIFKHCQLFCSVEALRWEICWSSENQTWSISNRRIKDCLNSIMGISDWVVSMWDC